ncbi:MAG: zinc ribbon domain-containing protein [Chlamydiota bacterium]|nr:zinc ribbon domain-containing protein [Chlamydiota bacterium]
MPTYEYLCNKCNNKFEKFQSMKDNPVKICPKCKSRSVKRLIGTGAGLMFKGSGFYITDYRSEGYQKAKSAEEKPAKETSVKKENATSPHKNKK